MIAPHIFEGTAEEVADKLRASNISGHLKVIVVQEEPVGSMQDADQPNMADDLAAFLKEVDQEEFVPGKPMPDPLEANVSRLIAERFRKQGHTQ